MEEQLGFASPKALDTLRYSQYMIVLMFYNSPPPCSPESIFETACKEFRASLSKSQLDVFASFPDARSMLTSIEQQANTHPTHKSALTRCCHKIEKISNRLSPFMRVIDLMVSSHPEFAAIAWGSLSLVFTVSNSTGC